MGRFKSFCHYQKKKNPTYAGFFPFGADNRTHIALQSALLADRKKNLAVPVCAPTSLKTIINRFLHARCLLKVQVLLPLPKEKEPYLCRILSLWCG